MTKIIPRLYKLRHLARKLGKGGRVAFGLQDLGHKTLKMTMTTLKSKNIIPKIELLGIGSIKNRQLKANLEQALSELDIPAPILEVSEIQKLLKYDVVGIPALVVDDKVIFQKVVPEVEDLKIVLNVLFNYADRDFSINNILVPIDFSPESENTLRYALDLAKATNAKVNVVHVLSSEVELNPVPLKSLSSQPKTQREVQAELIEFVEKHANGVSDVINDKLIRIGLVTDELLQMSQLSQTDLIVLGAKGKGGGLGKWFGRVAATVARKALCPVLIVPNEARFTGFDKIVYASDFHPSEEKTLPKVVYLGKRFNASIHFVHVVQNYLNGYMVDSEWPSKRFQFDNAPFMMTSVECDDVAEGLNRFAKEKQADLMVMTTGKRNFFEDLFHRSMTQKMVYNTKIPLLVMHFEEE